MGKVRKSDERGRKRNKKKSFKPTLEEQAGDVVGSLKTTPAILQRLRHADAKTRQAALAALLHTRFHPDTLNTSSGSGKPPSSSLSSSTELLQAVRDQVCNSDLHCSIAATSCLGNYLAFSSVEEDTASAGWLIIFLIRLQECLGQIKTLDGTLLLLWLELTEKCTYCLVHLLENNPAALDRLMTAPQQQLHGAESLHTTLTQLLQRSQLHHVNQTPLSHQIQGTGSVAAAVASNSNNNVTSAAATFPASLTAAWNSIQTLAARCLHSVWDDNENLVLPYLSKGGAATGETLEVVRTIILSQRGLPSVAALHCIGAWMAAWLILLVGVDKQQQQPVGSYVKAVMDDDSQVVPRSMLLLRQAVTLWDVSGIRPFVDKLKPAESEYKAEQADDELEQEILKVQNQKKEPTRLIARRLKQQKTENDVAAMEDGGNGTKYGGDKVTKDRRDKAALWDEVQADWQEAVRPVQLAVEILVNLTSAQQATSNDDDDDVIMEQDNSMALTIPKELAAKLLESQLPDSVYKFFGQLSDWFNNFANDDIPTTVLESLSDLLCKAAISLRHCLSNLPGWQDTANACFVPWSVLKRAAAISNDGVQEAVTSTMVVALRCRSCVRTQIDDVDFNDLLTLLSTASATSSPVVARDAITMLGILCSDGAHSVQVNERVCQALVQVSASPPAGTVANGSQQYPTAMVLAEALSVLMDIYGEDDCHPTVFGSLDVLGHFQRTLPLLKQKIAVEQLTKNRSTEEIEQWKETAMNAARFIQYKKGHLS